ncbi:MAG: Cof-type HAD-IIB family hydrolase [Lachnospiraceae bacterium]
MIRLIAVDLDGTLLNSKKEISPENIAAIRMAKEAGIQVMISSGREYPMVEALLNKYEISMSAVLLNGAEYRDEQGKILIEFSISKENSKKISEIFDDFGLHNRIYAEEGMFTFSDYEGALQEMMFRMQAFYVGLTQEDAHIRAINDQNFKSLHFVERTNEFWDSVKVKKFVAFHMDRKLLHEAATQIKSLPDIITTSSFKDNIEVTSSHAQKGSSLRFAGESLGIHGSEIMVIGDSFNDISMFHEFENSVAMSNGEDSILQIAKHKTLSNDEHGVAYAIRKVLQNEW